MHALHHALTCYSYGLQGTAKRWDQVAAYVRTRTVPEVIDMAKHGLKAGLGAAKKANFVPTGKRSNTAIKSDATARHEVTQRPPHADIFIATVVPVDHPPASRVLRIHVSDMRVRPAAGVHGCGHQPGALGAAAAGCGQRRRDPRRSSRQLGYRQWHGA